MVDNILSNTNKIEDIFNLTLNLKTYEYKFKNNIANASNSKIGWLSQEIQRIKPDLITKDVGVEPNIMQEFNKSTNNIENTFNYDNNEKKYTLHLNNNSTFTQLKTNKKYEMYFYNTINSSNLYDVYIYHL